MSTIDALPPSPDPDDGQAAFDLAAETFVDALHTFRSQANTVAGEVNTNATAAASSATAAASSATASSTSATASGTSATAAAASAATAVNAPGTSGTSTTSLSVGIGAKSLTTQTGKAWVAGQPVIIARTSAPTNTWMAGIISAYNSGTGVLDVTVPAGWTQGSGGPFTDWTIGLTAPTPSSIAAFLVTGAATGSSMTMATDRLLGRTTASTGAIEELAVGARLALASGTLNTKGVTRKAKTGAYTVVLADDGDLIDCTSGTFTLSFDPVATLVDKWSCVIRNSGTGVITLDPNGAELLDGAATATLYAGEARLLYCDGAALRTILIKPGLVLAAAVATTSGTSIDFTGIPEGCKRITLMLSGVSVSGTSDLIVQIGDSGGVETSGYNGTRTNQAGTVGTWSAGAQITLNNSASRAWYASIVLTLVDASDNTWAISGNSGDTTGPLSMYFTGTKALSGVLDRVRLTTVGGTDTFDAGKASINHE